MSYYNNRRSRYSDWGKIYGIDPATLTLQQLKSLDFTKLIEIVDVSPQALDIVIDKLFTSKIDEIAHIRRWRAEDINYIPKLHKAYNKFLKDRASDIEAHMRSSYSSKSDYYMWAALDDYNKLSLIKKQFNNSNRYYASNVIPHDIDYNWLYSKDTDLFRQVVRHMLVATSKFRDYMLDNIDYNILYASEPELSAELIKKAFNEKGSLVNTVIVKMPPDVYKVLLPQIFRDENKSIQKYTLSRRDTPESYTLKALRTIANRTNVPVIKVDITTKMLQKLPPVTRLNVISSIIYSSQDSSFVDLTEDDLRHMLFTTTVRYPNKVKYVIDRFKLNKAINIRKS